MYDRGDDDELRHVTKCSCEIYIMNIYNIIYFSAFARNRWLGYSCPGPGEAFCEVTVSIQLPFGAFPNVGLGDRLNPEFFTVFSALYAAGPGLVSFSSKVFLGLFPKVAGPFT